MENNNTGFRAKIQKFGGVLSGMVMPNIGAFITWGLITAIFLQTGWHPNAHIAKLISPMLSYLLPILIGYTGGKNFYGDRGGVIGAAATMGVIVGADIPMFMGAMIMGPVAALCMKQVDKLFEGKIKPGFEMIVNNFSMGILGIFLVLAAYYAIGPFVQAINVVLSGGVSWIIAHKLIPFASIFIEPAKVLFLNNVIDQGIYYPLGMQQALESGKSIFFMVASNPGAGLGLLLAYSIFGKGQAKKTAPGAIIIHFFGGIHEIYFPYVLMKPITILGMIAGSACGIITFSLFNVGLVAGPSPGSIFSYLALTPKGNFVGVIAGVLVATAVSFIVNGLLIKTSKDTDDEELIKSQERSKAMKQEGKDILEAQVSGSDIKKVVFACDAGLGSSAMGATSFRKRLEKAGIKMDVKNYAIEKVPEGVDVIVTHENLLERAESANPGIRIVTIQNFLKDQNIDNLYDEIVQSNQK